MISSPLSRLARLVWPVALMLAVVSPASGRNSAGGILTLHQAVARSLAENHKISAARHAEEATVWARRRAVSQLLPSISVESSYTRLDEETVARANAIGREITFFLPDSTGELRPVTIEIPQTVFRDGYETSLTGRMLLLSPAVWNGVSTAGTARDMARRQLTVTVNTTIHETVAAFIDLLRLATLTELQERHLEQARENEALARRLFEVGRYSEADVLRWNVEVAKRNSELYEQRRGVRLAALALENLMNVEPRGTTRPAPELPPRLSAEIDRFRNMSDESWERFLSRPLEDVVAGNPQLLVLEATERLAELDHRGSLTNFLPSVVVSGSYGWQ
ncbi:MAG: hypothetical protein GF355_05085, partial [Candidatus Eisenbacteria bacterium]|nr:hypothetical protein [Candidatus Eisenbacteria bacterium]